MKRVPVLTLSVVAIMSISCTVLASLGGGDEPVEQAPQWTASPVSAKPSVTILEPTQPPPSPTKKPEPSAAQPPPVPGPIVFQDDFSSDIGAWGDCEVCTWKDGVLHMGPAPVSGAGLQHIALCDACGYVTNYRMGVDVTFVEGPSEPGRGYGLVLKLNEETMDIYEINPFQTLDLWRFSFTDNRWDHVTGERTSSIRTMQHTNRIEVEVVGSGLGKSDVYLKVNGKTVSIAWAQSAGPGFVGLTIFGHAIEVMCDNFEFEELEPYSSEGASGGVSRRPANRSLARAVGVSAQGLRSPLDIENRCPARVGRGLPEPSAHP